MKTAHLSFAFAISISRLPNLCTLYFSEGAKKQKMDLQNSSQHKTEPKSSCPDEVDSTVGDSDAKQRKRKHKSSESSVDENEAENKEKQQKLSENKKGEKVESVEKSDKRNSSVEEPKSDVCKMESALKRKSLDVDASKDSKRVRISDKIAVKEINKRKRKRRPSKVKNKPKDIPELRVMPK